MLKDILEESWAYQEMVAQGLEKGLQQGLQEGEIQGLREAVIVIITERFPDIADFAQKQVNTLSDAARLRHLIAATSKADSVQQIREALSATTEEN
jgi:flagellar biosynthesis/type III secretory pathway protein FliH